MTSHCITWHDTTQAITSHDVTITWPDPATDIKTSKHFTSKHKTSPPWNGRRLVHSKEMIWASRWSVALRTFYRQILFVLYSSFPFGNFRPRLVRALLVYIIFIHICCTLPSRTSSRWFDDLSSSIASASKWLFATIAVAPPICGNRFPGKLGGNRDPQNDCFTMVSIKNKTKTSPQKKYTSQFL